jgi:hypothetical protein
MWAILGRALLSHVGAHHDQYINGVKIIGKGHHCTRRYLDVCAKVVCTFNQQSNTGKVARLV